MEQKNTIPPRTSLLLSFRSSTIASGSSSALSSSSKALFGIIKQQATKAKLQTDLYTLNQKISNRKGLFGIELYSLLSQLECDTIYGGIQNIPECLLTIRNSSKNKNNRLQEEELDDDNVTIIQEKDIKIPLEKCRADIQVLTKQLEMILIEIGNIRAQREELVGRPKIVRTNSTKLLLGKIAGTNLADTATITKLQLDIYSIERKIQQRKESFGNDVFDILIRCDNDNEDSTKKKHIFTSSNNNNHSWIKRKIRSDSDDDDDHDTVISVSSSVSRSSTSSRNSSSSIPETNSIHHHHDHNGHKKEEVLTEISLDSSHGSNSNLTYNNNNNNKNCFVSSLSSLSSTIENQIKYCCVMTQQDITQMLIDKRLLLKEIKSIR